LPVVEVEQQQPTILVGVGDTLRAVVVADPLIYR